MKINFFLLPTLIFSLCIISCESDDHDDHDDECHECHVLCALDDGSTHEHEIGEFCGDDLHDLETNGYTLPSEMTIAGVTYPAGHVFDASQLCCEEHADH